MRTSADICVHLRTSADICVHVRSLKNRSVLGPRFLCAGAVLGSPTFQNPRAHRSNSIPSKVVVLLTRNDSFQKNMPFYLSKMQVSERWMCLGMAQGPYGRFHRGRNGKCGFRKVSERCRIYDNHEKLSEQDPYGTSRAETWSK